MHEPDPAIARLPWKPVLHRQLVILVVPIGNQVSSWRPQTYQHLITHYEWSSHIRCIHSWNISVPTSKIFAVEQTCLCLTTSTQAYDQYQYRI